MKVWITKYALTTGVFTRSVEDCGDGMVADRSSSFSAHYLGEGRDWHRTRASAVKRVEAMRAAKFKSIEKLIAKLNESIEVPE